MVIFSIPDKPARTRRKFAESVFVHCAWQKFRKAKPDVGRARRHEPGVESLAAGFRGGWI